MNNNISLNDKINDLCSKIPQYLLECVTNGDDNIELFTKISSLYKQVYDDQEYGLIEALQNGNIKISKYIITNGSSINAQKITTELYRSNLISYDDIEELLFDTAAQKLLNEEFIRIMYDKQHCDLINKTLCCDFNVKEDLIETLLKERKVDTQIVLRKIYYVFDEQITPKNDIIYTYQAMMVTYYKRKYITINDLEYLLANKELHNLVSNELICLVYKNKKYINEHKDVMKKFLELNICIYEDTIKKIFKCNNKFLTDIILSRFDDKISCKSCHTIYFHQKCNTTLEKIFNIIYKKGNNKLAKQVIDKFIPSKWAIEQMCIDNNIELFDHCISTHGNINFGQKDLLYIMCRHKHINLMDRITMQGFDINDENYIHMLFCACDHEHYEAINYIITNGCGLHRNLYGIIEDTEGLALYSIIANYSNNIFCGNKYNLRNLLCKKCPNTYDGKKSNIILDKYHNRTLFEPKKYCYFPDNKKQIIFTLMLVGKELTRLLKQIVPKPVIYIIINKFIFD